MAEDLIRYDILAQEALRSVIRKVLEEVARTGLPGEHHFFITFQTTYPGVRISPRMLERYPEEMTIVVQHTFWNLEVGDSAFEIDLSFDEIRERLRIPYTAVRGFFDPSVKFGLQFDVAVPISVATGPDENAASRPSVASVPPIRIGGGKVPGGKQEAPAKSGRTARKDAEKSDNGAQIVSLDTFRKRK